MFPGLGQAPDRHDRIRRSASRRLPWPDRRGARGQELAETPGRALTTTTTWASAMTTL